MLPVGLARGGPCLAVLRGRGRPGLRAAAQRVSPARGVGGLRGLGRWQLLRGRLVGQAFVHARDRGLRAERPLRREQAPRVGPRPPRRSAPRPDTPHLATRTRRAPLKGGLRRRQPPRPAHGPAAQAPRYSPTAPAAGRRRPPPTAPPPGGHCPSTCHVPVKTHAWHTLAGAPR